MFEVDRLEDTLGIGKSGGYVYHVYWMNGGDHGENIGGDFGSMADAQLYIINRFGVK